jgi:hypothetical protein
LGDAIKQTPTVAEKRRATVMEANTKYLTLALDVRTITDSLIEFVEEEKELPVSNDLLGSFLNSLTERTTGVSVKTLSDMGRFGNYESLRTINELLDSGKKKELMTKLQAVSNPSCNARQSSALKAIEILDALEGTALYYYEHPGSESRLAFAR